VDKDLAYRLEAIAAEAAVALRLASKPRDWLDEILDADGDGLKSDEAAYVAGVHIDTIRDRAKAAAITDPTDRRSPGWRRLVVQSASTIGCDRNQGRTAGARLAAESRVNKTTEFRLGAHSVRVEVPV